MFTISIITKSNDDTTNDGAPEIIIDIAQCEHGVLHHTVNSTCTVKQVADAATQEDEGRDQNKMGDIIKMGILDKHMMRRFLFEQAGVNTANDTLDVDDAAGIKALIRSITVESESTDCYSENLLRRLSHANTNILGLDRDTTSNLVPSVIYARQPIIPDNGPSKEDKQTTAKPKNECEKSKENEDINTGPPEIRRPKDRDKSSRSMSVGNFGARIKRDRSKLVKGIIEWSKSDGQFPDFLEEEANVMDKINEEPKEEAKTTVEESRKSEQDKGKQEQKKETPAQEGTGKETKPSEKPTQQNAPDKAHRANVIGMLTGAGINPNVKAMDSNKLEKVDNTHTLSDIMRELYRTDTVQSQQRDSVDLARAASIKEAPEDTNKNKETDSINADGGKDNEVSKQTATCKTTVSTIGGEEDDEEEDDDAFEPEKEENNGNKIQTEATGEEPKDNADVNEEAGYEEDSKRDEITIKNDNKNLPEIKETKPELEENDETQDTGANNNHEADDEASDSDKEATEEEDKSKDEDNRNQVENEGSDITDDDDEGEAAEDNEDEDSSDAEESSKSLAGNETKTKKRRRPSSSRYYYECPEPSQKFNTKRHSVQLPNLRPVLIHQESKDEPSPNVLKGFKPKDRWGEDLVPQLSVTHEEVDNSPRIPIEVPAEEQERVSKKLRSIYGVASFVDSNDQGDVATEELKEITGSQADDFEADQVKSSTEMGPTSLQIPTEQQANTKTKDKDNKKATKQRAKKDQTILPPIQNKKSEAKEGEKQSFMNGQVEKLPDIKGAKGHTMNGTVSLQYNVSQNNAHYRLYDQGLKEAKQAFEKQQTGLSQRLNQLESKVHRLQKEWGNQLKEVKKQLDTPPWMVSATDETVRNRQQPCRCTCGCCPNKQPNPPKHKNSGTRVRKPRNVPIATGDRKNAPYGDQKIEYHDGSLPFNINIMMSSHSTRQEKTNCTDYNILEERATGKQMHVDRKPAHEFVGSHLLFTPDSSSSDSDNVDEKEK